jgi:hypothetical protein
MAHQSTERSTRTPTALSHIININKHREHTATTAATFGVPKTELVFIQKIKPHGAHEEQPNGAKAVRLVDTSSYLDP